VQTRLFLLGRLTPYRRRVRARAGWATARSLTSPLSLWQPHSAYLCGVLCAGNVLICRIARVRSCVIRPISCSGCLSTGSLAVDLWWQPSA